MGLAVVVVGSSLVRADLQLDRVQAFVDDEREQSARARADAALAAWGDAWLDTWLRSRELPTDHSEELRGCVEDYLYLLDRISVSNNEVRFETIERGRNRAEACVGERVGPKHGRAFVPELQRRWSRFLEQRGDAVPRF